MSHNQVWIETYSNNTPFFTPAPVVSTPDPAAVARSAAPLRLLVCPAGDDDRSDAYADFTTMLAARLDAAIMLITADTTLSSNAAATDLLLYHEPSQPRLSRWLFGPPACFEAAQSSRSLLVIRQPRPTLRNILFISRGQAKDMAAAEWVSRCALPPETRITALAVQPHLSGMDSRALYNDGLTDWLNSRTPLGDQLRKIARRLPHHPIDEHLRLTILPGQPHRQIKQAVAIGQPDLIVMSADSTNWCERRLLGELVDPLLHWADRPVLIAKN